jgi:hypothetical protein
MPNTSPSKPLTTIRVSVPGVSFLGRLVDRLPEWTHQGMKTRRSGNRPA